MTIFGNLALDGARRTVTVEREYTTTAADLWSALTEPERIARWIGRYTTDGDGYRLEMGDGSAVVTGRVLACEPEKRRTKREAEARIPSRFCTLIRKGCVDS